jgi:hypothetical protein
MAKQLDAIASVGRSDSSALALAGIAGLLYLAYRVRRRTPVPNQKP